MEQHMENKEDPVIYIPGNNPGIDINVVPLIQKSEVYQNISIKHCRLTSLMTLSREYGVEGIAGLYSYA